MVTILKDKEEVKSVMNIIQAFADGKTIQAIDPYDDEWCNQTKLNFEALFEGQYRIKPEPKYRPFANAEECWQEMLKHQPFGWIKSKEATEDVYFTITGLTNTCGFMLNSPGGRSFSGLYDYYTFIDGTPFGIKEEE